MRIFVKTKAGSKENRLELPAMKLWQTEKQEDYHTVYVKEPPKEGKANDAVIRILADHFKVSRNQIRLVSGATSKTKVFEIL